MSGIQIRKQSRKELTERNNRNLGAFLKADCERSSLQLKLNEIQEIINRKN